MSVTCPNRNKSYLHGVRPLSLPLDFDFCVRIGPGAEGTPEVETEGLDVAGDEDEDDAGRRDEDAAEGVLM